MYEYKAVVRSVYDGDTFRADVDLGFGVWKFSEPFRLVGLQAPELGSVGGREARDWLRVLLPVGAVIKVHTIKDAREKYGRYLADVFAEDGCWVNQLLIRAGHAVAWDGTGPRPM